MNFEDADNGQIQGPFDTGDSGSDSGESPGLSPSSGPIDRLFDGDAPGPSTTELEQEYGMNKHQAVAGRGVLRTATGSGVPPIFEILFGGAMWVLSTREADAEAVESRSTDDMNVQDAGDLPPPQEEM
jgi:hypothetical protein